MESDGGFGGAAAHALTELRDDFPRAPVLLFALQQSALPPARLPGQDQVCAPASGKTWGIAGTMRILNSKALNPITPSRSLKTRQELP